MLFVVEAVKGPNSLFCKMLGGMIANKVLVLTLPALRNFSIIARC